MDLGLTGRTALVSGASSGLGLASAEALSEEGANVVLFARRADQLEQHAARLGGVAVAGDVNEDGWTDVVVYYWGRAPVAFLRRPGYAGQQAQYHDRHQNER